MRVLKRQLAAKTVRGGAEGFRHLSGARNQLSCNFMISLLLSNIIEIGQLDSKVTKEEDKFAKRETKSLWAIHCFHGKTSYKVRKDTQLCSQLHCSASR